MIDCTSLHVLDCWTRDAILGAADPSATDTVPCDIMGGHYIFDTEFGCIDISDDEDLDGEPMEHLQDFWWGLHTPVLKS